MIPELLFYEEAAYNEAAAAIQHQADLVQQALAAYNAVNGTQALATADLGLLVSDPKELLWQKLTEGQAITVGGLPVSKAKAQQMVEWPEGTDTFVQTVEQIRRLNWPSNVPNMELLEINLGAVRADPVKLDALKEQFRYYATTQKQLDVWQAMQAVGSALDTLRAAHYAGQNLNWYEKLQEWLKVDTFNGTPRGFIPQHKRIVSL